jgi:hypothetical protein
MFVYVCYCFLNSHGKMVCPCVVCPCVSETVRQYTVLLVPLLECPCESSYEYMGAITHVSVVYFLIVVTVPKVCIVIIM